MKGEGTVNDGGGEGMKKGEEETEEGEEGRGRREQKRENTRMQCYNHKF